MKPGTVISGKYRLESLMAQGGMGSIWRAEHLGLSAPVVVKTMKPAMEGQSELLSRFRREAHAAAKLRSPHVVQVFDYGVDEATQHPFIAMELLEGEPLSHALRRGPLRSSETTHIVQQVASALNRAHEQGIVHRDLKPDNIFLLEEGKSPFVKILDFGVAKSEAPHPADTATRTGTLLGTPAYMSPEQIVGKRDLDARSDLWSLAVIVCECVLGRRPFQGDTIGALTLAICTEPIPKASQMGHCSGQFEAWLERGLMRDPADRFQTASELSDALQACLEPDAATHSASRSSDEGSLARKRPGAAGSDEPRTFSDSPHSISVAEESHRSSSLPGARRVWPGLAAMAAVALGTAAWWKLQARAPVDSPSPNQTATRALHSSEKEPTETSVPQTPRSQRAESRGEVSREAVSRGDMAGSAVPAPLPLSSESPRARAPQPAVRLLSDEPPLPGETGQTDEELTHDAPPLLPNRTPSPDPPPSSSSSAAPAKTDDKNPTAVPAGTARRTARNAPKRPSPAQLHTSSKPPRKAPTATPAKPPAQAAPPEKSAPDLSLDDVLDQRK